MEFVGDQSKSQNTDAFLAAENMLKFLGVADVLKNMLHLLRAHTDAIVLNKYLRQVASIMCGVVEAHADAAIFILRLFNGVSRVLHELFQCFPGAVTQVSQNLEHAGPSLKSYLSHVTPYFFIVILKFKDASL